MRCVRGADSGLATMHAYMVASSHAYQAMPPKRGLFGTLIPAVNPYLPMAFGYRQGIPNPYSLRAHHTRLPVKAL